MQGDAMAKLITTLGAYEAGQLGLILPHEHIFVDLGPIEQANWRAAASEEVIPVMVPELQRAREAGVTALVECTPVGVGRRVDIVCDVSRAANFPVVVATGIYREPWVPQWAHDASEEDLYNWMLGELTGQIEESGVQAAWIKLSAGDDGITPCEAKILRAAARAAGQVHALIGSHTIRGSVVRNQLDIIESAGYSPSRYIWIHTQADPDFDLHLEMGRRGCWLEYDALGSEAYSDEWFVDRIIRLLDAGFGKQLLLSHDRGWYDPSQPLNKPQHFTYLSKVFLPKLSAAGVDDAIIRQLTVDNPFNAFAR
jgi:phosphotriesterase-related protein